MLLKLSSNKINRKDLKNHFSPTIFQTEITRKTQSHNPAISFHHSKLAVLFFVKVTTRFHFHNIFEIQRFSPIKFVFSMGNRKNRRTRRTTSQFSDRDENTPETSFAQGDATLTNVSENVNEVFDRNLGSELTEPSQIGNEIEVISQRLEEQNNDKTMSQIEKQLNNKFEEIPKEIRTNKNYRTIKKK